MNYTFITAEQILDKCARKFKSGTDDVGLISL